MVQPADCGADADWNMQGKQGNVQALAGRAKARAYTEHAQPDRNPQIQSLPFNQIPFCIHLFLSNHEFPTPILLASLNPLPCSSTLTQATPYMFRGFFHPLAQQSIVQTKAMLAAYASLRRISVAMPIIVCVAGVT